MTARAILCTDLGNGNWYPYEPYEFEASTREEAKAHLKAQQFDPKYIGLYLELDSFGELGQQIISMRDGRVVADDGDSS